MADSMITESAQRDSAELLSENLRAATPIDSMNDKEQQPLESSEKSSKPKDINSADKSELMESRDATPKKSRSYRKTNVRRNSESDDEGMEQHNKGSSKKGKSPNDRKTGTDGSNETPKKRSRGDPNVTPRKRQRSGSKESSEEKSGGHSKDRPRRKSRSRSRDRSREDSSDTPRKHHRKRSRERSKERSGKHSNEKSGTQSGERGERSRDRHLSESKSPGKEKVIESHGNNSSNSPQKSRETLNSTAVKKTPQKQKTENDITNLSQKGTPQKKKDKKETRFSPIFFDEPKKTDNSRSWRKEYSLKLLQQDKRLDKREHFCFFFGKDAPFSNFHPARFTVDGVIYTCSEQFMMHQKAVLFRDWFHAEEIMKAKVPLQMKKFGRKVQNFNADIWGARSEKIMKRGLKAKFTENEHLKRELINTFPRILVEASPRDRLWGIGLGAKNEKAHCRLTWRGKNKLGYLLTYIRNEIMEEEGLFH
eukprot:XP_019928824.1 PREDICTED: serine/arginine-rich splicing factor 4 [Crassostrea gigas]